jgi:hypothetical protein
LALKELVLTIENYYFDKEFYMLKLELSIDEVNMILRVMGKHPFEEVVNLINKIQEQCSPQVAALVQAEQEAAAETPAV